MANVQFGMQVQNFINALNRANIFPAQYDIIHSHWRSTHLPGGLQYRRRRQVNCQTLCRISVMQEARRLGINNYNVIRFTTFRLWAEADADERQSYVNLKNQLNY
ncbi:23915_t:CDS:1 [Dentiscutata erythropus]|uniref:23915_t:CDS:1 n=1 Tax=Dentiscutata erythropus TaxID=1348616 RepID=A0A9N9FJU0_9GLOM|nr:23915_t:CDS:1 [Dentiscutata erythropus]